jgi:hypothetical protein
MGGFAIALISVVQDILCQEACVAEASVTAGEKVGGLKLAALEL